MTRSMTGGRRATGLAVGAAAVALALTGCSAGQIAETALKQASVSGVTADSADQKLAVRGLAVAYEGVEGYPAGGNAPLHVTLINQTADPLTVEIGVAAPENGADPTATTARAVQIVSGSPAQSPASASPQASASASPQGSAPQTSESPTGQQADPKTSDPASTDEEGNEVGEAADPKTSGSGSPGASPSAGGASPTQSPVPAGAGRPASVTIPGNGAVTFTAEDAEKLTLIGLVGQLRSGMTVSLTFQAVQGGAPSPLLTVRAPVDIPLTPAPREAVEEEHHE